MVQLKDKNFIENNKGWLCAVTTDQSPTEFKLIEEVYNI